MKLMSGAKNTPKYPPTSTLKTEKANKGHQNYVNLKLCQHGSVGLSKKN
jgi:hypothetical protein